MRAEGVEGRVLAPIVSVLPAFDSDPVAVVYRQ